MLAGLLERGWDAVAIDWAEGTSLPQLLEASRARVVWNALHGTYGEDGAVQGLCTCMQIACTGSGILASALAMDKVMSKRIFESNGVPTPRWRLLPRRRRCACRRQRRARAARGLAAAMRRQARERGQLGRRQHRR